MNVLKNDIREEIGINMMVKFGVVVQKVLQELKKGFGQFMLRMSTPMHSFLIDGQVNHVLNILKDQRLTDKLIISHKRLDCSFIMIGRVKTFFNQRCHT